MGVFIAISVMIFCLYKLFSGDSSSDKSNENEIIFKSSFTRGGSLIAPQKLIFKPSKITLITNAGSRELYTTTTTQTIPFKNIVGIQVTRNIIGCHILIIGKGFQNMLATDFTGADSNKIEQMINTILEKS